MHGRTPPVAETTAETGGNRSIGNGMTRALITVAFGVDQITGTTAVIVIRERDRFRLRNKDCMKLLCYPTLRLAYVIYLADLFFARDKRCFASSINLNVFIPSRHVLRDTLQYIAPCIKIFEYVAPIPQVVCHTFDCHGVYQDAYR
jgi:hypothetical protein